MSNTYIDLGCYDGDTVEQFRNWSKLAFPERSEWEIYAFDPNPKFNERWEVVSDDRTYFYHMAAWIEDGELEFAVDQADNPLGSTVMSGKKKIWDNNPKITVKAFDFSAWLRLFKGDFVIVKMDIEGAEFPILRKMIDDGTVQICDHLLVEFHPAKVVEYLTTDKLDLIEELKSLGVNILEWH